MHLPSILRAALPTVLAPLLFLGCGDDGVEGRASSRVDAVERSDDPRVIRARKALDWGRAGEARALVEMIGDSAGIESSILRMRLAYLEGDFTGALRLGEEARRAWPGDGRVYATLAELYAWSGRIQGAEEEIRRGLTLDPRSPDLLRARAVARLGQTGGGESGMAMLEEALAADPELPYAEMISVRGNVLLSRTLGSKGDFEGSIRAARAAVDIAPADLEARETLAEAYGAARLFDHSIPLLEELLAEGVNVGSVLAHEHKSAATKCILQTKAKDVDAARAESLRQRAIDHWLRARELGIPPSELGFGREVLNVEAQARVDLGIEDYEFGRYDEALESFRSALAYDPEHLEARAHLGTLLLKLSRPAEAAEAFQKVLVDSNRRSEELPIPVHVSLALALDQDGRRAEGCEVLGDYLDRNPEGEWVELTQSALDRLRP